MDSVALTPMTPADAAAAIGKRVETAATGMHALVVNVGTTGAAVLIRSVAKRGGYFWVDAASLIRRADCDAHPEPEWLQQARVSRRPPLVLDRILRPVPTYDVDEFADQPPASLDPVTYHQFEISMRERSREAR